MSPPAHPRSVYGGAAVAAVAREREMWLAAVTELLARHAFVAGVWLVGSLGRGVSRRGPDRDGRGRRSRPRP